MTAFIFAIQSLHPGGVRRGRVGLARAMATPVGRSGRWIKQLVLAALTVADIIADGGSAAR
jgi:hypothetical protein